MKNLLRKLKLIDDHSFELEISREEFTEKLKQNVIESDTGLFSGMFEAFSSNDLDYKGEVSFDSFEIKKRKRMFERNMNFSKTKGKLFQNGKNLTVETEIDGFPRAFIAYYILIPAFYLIFFGGFFMTDMSSEIDFPTIFFPLFITLHAIFMLGLPIFIMRKNVKRTKKNIEKDLFYIANKK